MHSESKITLAYLLFGLLWIFLTDQGVLILFPGHAEVAPIQTFKGSLYVLLSGLVVFALSRLYFRQRRDREADRLRIFQDTVRASNHILRNYLNQMNLVLVEAEGAEGFDPSVLRRAEEATRKASEQLDELGKLENFSIEEVGRLAYEEAFESNGLQTSPGQSRG